jgi:hypothetical protein
MADDWMSWPSTYSHDSQGTRVDQYAMPVEPVAPNRSEYSRSIYRNYRSSLQAGQSADNYHVVEQVGAPIEPYEQWRFPFRPYGVPYDAWGPQTPLTMINGLGVPGFPGPYPPQHHHHVPGSGTTPGGGAPGGGMHGGGMHGGWGPGTGGPAWPGSLHNYSPYGPAGGGTGGYPFGFPLQPNYSNQPWFDGTYPDTPPLDTRTDQQFFWQPPR